MESLYLLVPLSLLLLVLAAAVFRWAVRHGQFDDLDRQGHSILFRDPADRTDD